MEISWSPLEKCFPSCDRCQLLLKLILLLHTSFLPIKSRFYMQNTLIPLWIIRDLCLTLFPFIYWKGEPRPWVWLIFSKLFKTRSSPSTINTVALFTLLGKAQISTNLIWHKVPMQKLWSLADHNTGIKPSSLLALKRPFNCMLISSPLTKTKQKNKQTNNPPSLTWEAAFRGLKQNTEIKAISSKANTSRCTGEDSKQYTRHKNAILHPNRFPR